MSGSFRVRFRTGRDSDVSEARSSAGAPQSKRKARRSPAGASRRSKISQRPDHSWDADSLHRKMQAIARGLETSCDNGQLEEFLADAVRITDFLVGRYDSSEVLNEDVEGLHDVLEARRPNLVEGSSRQARYLLRALSRSLERTGARCLQVGPSGSAQSASSQIFSIAPAKHIKKRTPTFGR